MIPARPPCIPAFSGEAVTAFFTTRLGGVSRPPFASLNLGRYTSDLPDNIDANWARLLGAYGLENRLLRIPKLVHGNGLLDADAADDATAAENEAADAIYSRDPNTVLAVTAADCLPVLIHDPATRLIAAVHAGWRGTRALILEKTLRALLAKNLIRASTVLLVFGPCLQANRLEIGSDLAETLPAKRVLRQNDRVTFDIPGANLDQALRMGIPAAHIEIRGECTWEDEERFFSHRRDGGATGRMAAIIALESPRRTR